MSYGKLNIWIRFQDCSLVKTCWRTDLVIKTCNGGYLVDMDPSILDKLRKDFVVEVHDYRGERRIMLKPENARYFNHIEMDVPPGCYVIWTRVCFGDNEETNKIMAIVDCNKEVCVNLLLNDVKTCAREALHPVLARGVQLGLPKDYLQIAGKVLLQVAEIPEYEEVFDPEQRDAEFKDVPEDLPKDVLEEIDAHKIAFKLLS